MAVELGTKRISSEQDYYLDRARRQDIPDEILIETFVTVATDEEIRSGKEQLHPDWNSFILLTVLESLNSLIPDS